MAIEDNRSEHRKVWNDIARVWYSKRNGKSPDNGHLYHHLAVLARPSTLEQLSLFTRALTCMTPYEDTMGSIKKLFQSVLQRETVHKPSSSLDILIIRAHAIIFFKKIPGPGDNFEATVDELQRSDVFDKYADQAGPRFKKVGACAAMSNIAALFEYRILRYGASDSRLRHALREGTEDKGRRS